MSPDCDIAIRRATEDDVAGIHKLLAVYAAQQQLLARSPEDILYHIKNFVISEVAGKIIACCALRDFGGRLYEVRSLAVAGDFSGKGLASKIVKYLVDGMTEKAPCRIFALTYHPKLFIRLGFCPVSKELFPPKIWCDCSSCPRKDHCDEEAVMIELD